MTIHVSKDVEDAIHAAVQSGQFASADEMVDRLVRDYAQRTQPPPPPAAPAPETLLEMVDEVRKRVPPEEFSNRPTDGARRLDGSIDREPAASPPAADGDAAAAAHQRIWEVAAEIRKSVPEEEWAKLPVDGAEQHDHYIYGTPKRPPAR